MRGRWSSYSVLRWLPRKPPSLPAAPLLLPMHPAPPLLPPSLLLQGMQSTRVRLAAWWASHRGRRGASRCGRQWRRVPLRSVRFAAVPLTWRLLLPAWLPASVEHGVAALARLWHAWALSSTHCCTSSPKHPTHPTPPTPPPQVHLGDLPADTTGRRLADGILSSSLPLLLGSVVAAATSAIVLSQGLLDSGAAANPLAVAGLSAVPLAAALAPVVAPLLEVGRFAGMSAQQIEDTVRLKEPIQVGQGGGGWQGRGRRLPAAVGRITGERHRSTCVDAASPGPPKCKRVDVPLLLPAHHPHPQAASEDAPIVKLWGEDALLNWPGAM